MCIGPLAPQNPEIQKLVAPPPVKPPPRKPPKLPDPRTIRDDDESPQVKYGIDRKKIREEAAEDAAKTSQSLRSIIPLNRETLSSGGTSSSRAGLGGST